MRKPEMFSRIDGQIDVVRIADINPQVPVVQGVSYGGAFNIDPRWGSLDQPPRVGQDWWIIYRNGRWVLLAQRFSNDEAREWLEWAPDGLWHMAELQSPWTGGIDYRRVQGPVVHLRGEVTGGSTEPICVLPRHYRPIQPLKIVCGIDATYSYGSLSVGQVSVGVDGVVTPVPMPAAQTVDAVVLDGVSFIVAV